MLIIASSAFSQTNDSKTEFQLGDELRIFAKKVLRKGSTGRLEAIGNVVIINGQDTLYGQTATFEPETGDFNIKGNVRYVSDMATLYGSELNYNINTRILDMLNARIVTGDFTLLASSLKKQGKNQYIAQQAEYSTCRDCPESWSIYGEEVVIDVGQYAKLSHALVKIKGVSVFYIPYIVFPIKKGRESGLLYPSFSARFSEGLALELPWYWAINESTDMTLSPTFWAQRGYGGDFEFRQILSEKSWYQVNTRSLNDTIYLPGKFDREKSGTNYFRYFSDIETHLQPTHDFNVHFHSIMAKDLDIVRDHPMYTEERILDLSLPNRINFDYRADWLSASLEGEWNRNQLYNDVTEFDDSYVQSLPTFRLSSSPLMLWSHSGWFLNKMMMSFDSQVNVFKQNKISEGGRIRNASRLHLNPSINISLIENNYFTFKTNISHEQQVYKFRDRSQKSFQKYSTLMKSEISFEFDKVFGLAYQGRYDFDQLTQEEKELLSEKKDATLKPLLKTQSDQNDIIGNLEKFEETLTEQKAVVKRNSYRHRQEFKVVHHYLLSDDEQGNQQFNSQIDQVQGRFDYLDAIKRDAFRSGDDLSRVNIPPENTVELQWNNVLLKKSPKEYNFFKDNQYLRDNFEYQKLAYFNVSQGFNMLSKEQNPDSTELTRLFVNAGINREDWSLGLSEYYFHDSQKHIFNAHLARRFDLMDIFVNYQYQDAAITPLKTLSTGITLSPIDLVELRYQQDRDFVAGEVIRNLIDIDYRPRNKCWIFNVSYRKTVVDSRFSFNLDVSFAGQ